MKKLLALFLLTSTVLLGACGKGSEQVAEESQDLQVITTFIQCMSLPKRLLEIQVKYLCLYRRAQNPMIMNLVRKIWQNYGCRCFCVQ